MAGKRRAWREAMQGLDPENLVFIDETRATRNMARRFRELRALPGTWAAKDRLAELSNPKARPGR